MNKHVNNRQSGNVNLSQKRKNLIIKIIVTIALLFSGSISLNDFFGHQNRQSSQIRQDQEQSATLYKGNNLEVFTPLSPIPVSFQRVVDGDTAIFSLNGHQVKVRYLMVDTPETKEPAQPYAMEAKNRNQEILKNAKQISIMFDKGSKDDKYGRLLAYVLADGEDVGGILISEGLGSVRYVVAPNNSKEADYRQIESEAKSAKLGIWN